MAAGYYKGRGRVYDEQKKWELALADYNQALKINPDYSCGLQGSRSCLRRAEKMGISTGRL
nr:tetratricopeptide repeat protein [Sphaerospermopsis torques-reginae]